MGHMNKLVTVKGSIYLLSAEIQAFYTASDKKLQDQCREWQNDAAELVYRGKVEDNGTFLMLSFMLFIMRKTLARFSLFHPMTRGTPRTSGTHVQANSELVQDAHRELTNARKHVDIGTSGIWQGLLPESEVWMFGKCKGGKKSSTDCP